MWVLVYIIWGMMGEQKGWGTKMFAQGPADEVLVCKCALLSSFNQPGFPFDMRKIGLTFMTFWRSECHGFHPRFDLICVAVDDDII